MTNLAWARQLMGISLVFHIVFAAAGVAMPLLLVLAEHRWRRTGDPWWLEIARRWAKGVAVLFAIGAVSGTVISFELGLLWPGFMEVAGPVIGFPFALEGFAFFGEAIFLGLYLYGRDKLSPRVHFASAVGIAVAGAASAFMITLVNVWMNSPTGFRLLAGRRVADVDPVMAMFSPGWGQEVLHVILSCYMAVGLAVAGIHAFALLREPSSAFHRRALGLALAVGGVATLLQPFSGDLSARFVARNEPVKLAAMEALFATRPGAPLRIGGIPDVEERAVAGALVVPGALSLLAFGDSRATVQGLDAAPRSAWPNVLLTHLFFDLMVICGLVALAVAAVGAGLAWRVRGTPTQRWYLHLLAWTSPLAFVALEAGWMVTELGRQPWALRGVMRTAEAVTPVTGLAALFAGFSAVYVILGTSVGVLIWREVHATLRPSARPRVKEAHA